MHSLLLPTLLFNLGFILANPTGMDVVMMSPTPHQLIQQRIYEINWEISKDICNVVPNCACIQASPRLMNISCKCDDASQIVNLRGCPDKQKYFSNKTWTAWTIEGCGRVVIQPKAFSAVNGEYFDLRLMNLSSVEINEEAFELPAARSDQSMRKITFAQVNIDKVPRRAFPSKLNVIQFISSSIETISHHAFMANGLDQISFTDTTVGTIENEAFFKFLLIDSWLVRKSHFSLIRTQGIASSVKNMSWFETKLDHLESFALNGDAIANASFEGNQIGVVESNGLTLQQWTWISFVNNTFALVNYSGIDLSKHAPTNYNVTEFSGNTWTELQPDFIVTSQTERMLPIVRNNRLMESCVCGKDIISKLFTKTESSPWFQEEFRNNSQCFTTSKTAECLGSDRTPDDGAMDRVFIPFPEWESTCNETVSPCPNDLVEVRSVFSTPTASPSRLRLFLILIASVGTAIVICLVGVLFVYMCRRSRPSPKSSPSNSSSANSHTHSHPHHPHAGELAKVLTKGSSMNYVDIVNNKACIPSSMSNGLNLSSRPRSTLFEDVEMEDKGVQTMPSELSTDVLEGLRVKLSHPDSFWDAKETIDHLYDLIHVRETSPLSSPPDVTMLGNGNAGPGKGAHGNSPPGQNGVSGKNTGTRSTSTSMPSPTALKLNRPLPARYAQIRSKPKTAPICEYGDPSDSQMHIYSELGPHNQGNNRQSTASTATQAYLCEYTEPKDVQTHVYAELNSDSPYPPPPQPGPRIGLSDQENMNFTPNAASTPVQSPQQRFDYPNVNSNIPKIMSPLQTQILDTPCPSTPPCQQRPLPSIPSFSNVQ